MIFDFEKEKGIRDICRNLEQFEEIAKANGITGNIDRFVTEEMCLKKIEEYGPVMEYLKDFSNIEQPEYEEKLIKLNNDILDCLFYYADHQSKDEYNEYIDDVINPDFIDFDRDLTKEERLSVCFERIDIVIERFKKNLSVNDKSIYSSLTIIILALSTELCMI